MQFRGSEGQIKFLIEKEWGRISVPAIWPGERYWGGLLFIHGCISPPSSTFHKEGVCGSKK